MSEKNLSRNYTRTFPRIKEHDSQVLDGLTASPAE